MGVGLSPSIVSFDLLSSLTATSEPSSENLSPLPISESDSTCNAVEPAIEADEPGVRVEAANAATFRRLHRLAIHDDDRRTGGPTGLPSSLLVH